MLNSLLIVTDKLQIGEAALYTILGFAITFAGIFILIGIISIFGAVMKKTNGDPIGAIKKLFEKKKKAEPVAESVEEVAASDEITDEEYAAVVAAIMAVLQGDEESEPKCEFVIRKIKRRL